MHPQMSRPPHVTFPCKTLVYFWAELQKHHKAEDNSGNEEARHKRFLLIVLQITAGIRAQDKWKRWTQDK